MLPAGQYYTKAKRLLVPVLAFEPINSKGSLHL